MQEIFPDKCLKIYREDLARNGIVVVLPAAGRKHLPYFTRLKWQSLFPDKCFIACADPSLLDNCAKLNGIWFLDKEKGSRLKDFAKWLNDFINIYVGNNKLKLVFTGSSMGGYASIYLASLFPGSFAFAECPQTNLLKYTGSKKAIKHIVGDNHSLLEEHINLVNLITKYKRVPNVHIYIPVTDVHHLHMHVAPYARAVGDYLRKDETKDVYFRVSVEHNETLPKGHAPIQKELFKEYIDNLFFTIANRGYSKVSLKQQIKKYYTKLMR